MSESATATAIPREINLGLQKPVATPAYTRRFKSQAQNPESTAGTQATITLDTAQPGSFIDTLESYLSFTLRLKNTTSGASSRGYNVSFSSCGAHALIRAMRIYVQGVPIEEITEYNALAEWLHDLTGIPDYCDRSSKSRYLANTMMGDNYIYVPAGETRDINIQLPLISGVLGTMAEKMFPSMLVAPGNCYIQLDIASAANALRIQEIDVSSLTVATNPIVGGGGQSTLRADEITFTDTAANGLTKLNTVQAAEQNAVMQTSAAGAMTGYLSATDILGDRPYDTPFAITDGQTTPAVTDGVGILTTEERIGGGIWNGFAPTSAKPLAVSNVMATSSLFNAGTYNTTVDEGVAVSAATYGAVTNVTAAPAGSEANQSVFLGTGLSASYTAVGNARKMNKSTISLDFSIVNLEYIGKQVVVGDDVARAIIERAAAGDISIHTQSYRQYPATISLSGWSYVVDPAYTPSTTGGATNIVAQPGSPLVNMFRRVSAPAAQSLIIPAKISSANAIYHIFRNGNGIEDFQFDSLRRMTIGFADGPNSSTSGVTAQLRIGNELIPQSPIQSASESLEELLKAHHMDGFYGTCEKMGSIVAASTAHEWTLPMSIAVRRGAFGAVLSDPPIARETGFNVSAATNVATSSAETGGVRYLRNDFNSQILCPNPDSVGFIYPSFAAYPTVLPAGNPSATTTNFFGPLGTSIATFVAGVNGSSTAHEFYKGTTHASQPYRIGFATSTGAELQATGYYVESQKDYADRQAKWRKAVRRAFFGYADERSDHQLKDPSKSNFLNPYRQHTGRYSTFMLGFDLDTFSNNTDTIRSGHYLGNNTVSLNLTGCQFIDNSPCNAPLMTNARMDTYVLHDLRLSFQAGGIVQAFY